MTSVLASGSVLVRGLLSAPRKPARILGFGRFCLYLDVAGEVLPVETSDGLGLPRAVQVAAPSAAGHFLRVRPGMPAFVGSGVVTVGPLTMSVVRWSRPRLVRTGTRSDRVTALGRALHDVRPAVDPTLSVTELLGRGPGLTPAGDDVLAGMLLGARGDDAAVSALVADVHAAGLHRTTTLSASLLEDAMQGYGIPPVLDLADWLTGHPPEHALSSLLDRLLRVGHSTGPALACGLARGARRIRSTSEEAA